jgi:hypothetical protein
VQSTGFATGFHGVLQGNYAEVDDGDQTQRMGKIHGNT